MIFISLCVVFRAAAAGQCVYNCRDEAGTEKYGSVASVTIPAATLGFIAVMFTNFANKGGGGGQTDYRAAGNVPNGNINSDSPISVIGADFAANHGFNGAGVKVAVLDTGVVGTAAAPAPDSWHGTAVANIVKSAASGVEIDAHRITKDNGDFVSYREIASHIGGTDAFVYNNSWGIPVTGNIGANEATQGNARAMLGDNFVAAIRGAVSARGAVFVWAAGNDGERESNFISGLPLAFSELRGFFINAVSYDLARDSLAASSNHCGATKDYCLAAPGENIKLSAFRVGNPAQAATFTGSGTSFAAPFVSAAVAILKSAHPAWSGEKITALMFSTARDLGSPDVYGRGMVDLENALESSVNLAELRTAPRPTSLARLQSFGAESAAPAMIDAGGMSFGFGVADHGELLGGLAEGAKGAAFVMEKKMELGRGAALKLSGRLEHSTPRVAANTLASEITDIYASEFSAEFSAGGFSFILRRPRGVEKGTVTISAPVSDDRIWSKRFGLRENPGLEYEAIYRHGDYGFGAAFAGDETMLMFRVRKRM